MATKSSFRLQFVTVTGASVSLASQWLDKYDWNLQESINGYLNQDSYSRARPLKIDSKLNAIYDKYKDSNNENKIDINGTIAYLEDLNFDPEHPISLTLAFFLEAPTMGVFTKEKFLNKWQNEKINSRSGMREFILRLHNDLETNHELFQELYNFTFGFLMEVPGQRLLNYELAVDYWRLLLMNKKEFEPCYGRLEQWFDFILNEYKRGLSNDTWKMFYLFIKTIALKDPSNFEDYDEMSAWPSVIDEYIEYLKENKLLN